MRRSNASFILLSHFGISLCVWSPFIENIESQIDPGINPCVDFYSHVCGMRKIYNLEALEVHTRTAYDHNCDLKSSDIAVIVNKVVNKYNNSEHQEEATERMEFEFEKIRWSCDVNISCYRENLMIFSKYFAFAFGEEFKDFRNLADNDDPTILQNGIHGILSELDELPLANFTVLETINRTFQRICYLSYEKDGLRRPFRMAKHYEELMKLYTLVMDTTKEVLKNINWLNSSNIEKELIKLHRITLFTPFDGYFNSLEFTHTLYSLFDYEALRKQIERKELFFSTDNSASTMNLISALIEKRLSTPMKISTAGFLLTKELVEMFFDDSSMSIMESLGEKLSCKFEDVGSSKRAMSNESRKSVIVTSLASRIVITILKKIKTSNYLQGEISASNPSNMTRYKAFFYTLGYLNCEKKMVFDIIFKELIEVKRAFGCQEGPVDNCTIIKSQKATELVKQLKQEHVRIDDDSSELMDDWERPEPDALGTRKTTTSTTPKSSRPNRPATAFMTTRKSQTTRPAIFSTRSSIGATNMIPSIAKIPFLQDLIPKGVPGVTINLNITIMSNNGNIEFKMKN